MLFRSGTDMFLSFQNWYKPEEILRHAGLCAFGRTEKDGETLFAPQRDFLGEKFPGSRIVTMTLPNLVDVSSTELRERIPKGKTAGLLAPAVLGYILREHLYGTNLDLKRLSLEELRPIALSYLKAKRIPHVLGTEQTAKELAERYGANVEKARFAALLHDATKRLSMDEQLALCEHYHIALDELEQRALKLLHAKTGAALARDVFGADDEIYNAILWHTTGKPGMAELEKELGRRIAAKLLPDADSESRIDFRDVTTMTAGSNIDDGTVDMVIAHMASQMSAKYTYSDSYYTEECILVVKTGTSAFALKSFTVGYIQSNRLRKTAEDITLSSYLAANSSLDIGKKSYASYPDMLSALDRGEIGGAVLPRQVFNELRTQYPITETTLVIGTIDYKVMCPGDSTVLSELASIVIRQMRDSGELAELYAQYGW